MPGSEKIRVLIVDDIAETRENIRKLLQFENDVEVVGAARTGREAIELSVEVNPDVVLMDINMPDMDGITATEAIRKRNPAIQIVILSVQGDPNYMRRAMLAGARDFLTKPPMLDELSAAIHRAGQMARDEKAKATIAAPQMPGTGSLHMARGGFSATYGKVIVVYSPKGGAGCTTVATNLAIALHNEDTPAALVDGNLQFGDVAVFLNEQGKNTILDLAPRADELDPDIISEVMVTHTTSGVKVLAAPTRPEQAEDVTGEQFGKVLNYLREMYSYIIVDTSSYLTDAVLAALDQADIVILLTTQDIPSVKSVRAFLALADGMKIQRQRILFVMNRYDKRISITPEKIGESLRKEISGVIPFDEKIVINSINRGVPFILDNKTQPVGRAILALAETVHQWISKFELPEPTDSIRR